MPGNKNSGRKKKVAIEDSESNEIQNKEKKKRGRPKKGEDASSETLTVISSEFKEVKSFEFDNNIHRISHQRGIFHPVHLQKRNSDINQFYDKYLGEAIEAFSSSRLPLKRTVLQRYRFLRTSSKHNSKSSEIVTLITKEIKELWEQSFVPHKDFKGCRNIVEECLLMWTDSKQEQKISAQFQKDLNTLLDLRTTDCKTLNSLKLTLKKNDSSNWQEDYEFFKGQMKYPQEGRMTSKDTQTIRKYQAKAERDRKNAAFAEKNKDEITSPKSKVSESLSSSTITCLSPDNILDSKRRSSKEKMDVAQTLLIDGSDISSEEEWEVPTKVVRNAKRKPETITLELPAKKIPTILAETNTMTKTSSRTELKIIATLFKAGGADLNDASISNNSIHRQRKLKVQSAAEEIRKTFHSFKTFTNTFLVLHFDGKIIQLFSGVTEDRLAIAVSSPCNLSGQFLASPAISDGTGCTMAKSLFRVVNEFGLVEMIHALVFDTTASNTGQSKGCATLFESILDHPVLWLACRHHVPELFIKHANQVIRGESKGPDDSLFKEFKVFFSFIDLEERTLWKWPGRRDWRHQRANEILCWADKHMQKETWGREDYRELLELVVIFLGGVVKRVRKGEVIAIAPVTIRKPGALHRARFMASSLYLLKISLYQKQFVTNPKNIADANILAEYIALIHAPYFLRCPLAITAPRLDRDLWVDLHRYQQCFQITSLQVDMIEAVKKSVLNHLWYLTEELVTFSLFDEDVSDNERQSMALTLISTPKLDNYVGGKPKFPVNLMVEEPTLDSFVGEKSWLLFVKLNANGNWMSKATSEWDKDTEYNRMRDCLKDLKVVNDLAERCVKDVQDYAKQAKDSQYQEDILIVATDHRRVFNDLRKRALTN